MDIDGSKGGCQRHRKHGHPFMDSVMDTFHLDDIASFQLIPPSYPSLVVYEHAIVPKLKEHYTWISGCICCIAKLEMISFLECTFVAKH